MRESFAARRELRLSLAGLPANSSPSESSSALAPDFVIRGRGGGAASADLVDISSGGRPRMTVRLALL